MNKKSPLTDFQVSLLKNCSVIFDIIYQPKITKLMTIAKKYNIFTFNGLKMNLEQAVIAFKITNKLNFSLEKIRKLMKR